MKIIKTILLLLSFFPTYSQVDSIHYIKVHFLYGSKPKKQFKSTEFKSFGGLHGGHVSIEVDDIDYNFEPTYDHHVFSHKHKMKADFVENKLNGLSRYSSTSKTVTFIIPLTNDQYNKIKLINQNYCKTTPYDYAFFGMRCANSTQDILGQIGVLKKKTRFLNVLTTFYPKKLRKRIFKVSKKKNYKIIKQSGRETRRWERD